MDICRGSSIRPPAVTGIITPLLSYIEFTIEFTIKFTIKFTGKQSAGSGIQ
jgi:hypothetical protein